MKEGFLWGVDSGRSQGRVRNGCQMSYSDLVFCGGEGAWTYSVYF